MIRLSVFLMLGLLLHRTVLPEEPVKETDTEELIQQLSSDNFATRNKATEALSLRAERIWGRLEQLAKSRDPEISQRAKLAMSIPGKKELQSALEVCNRKVTALNEESKETESKLNLKIRELSQKLENSEAQTQKLAAAVEALTGAAAEEKKKELASAKEADAALFKQIEEVTQEIEKTRIRLRAENNRLSTRIGQLKSLAESGEILKPGTAETWTPARWPFERRLKATVTFEFVDMPFSETLAFLREAAKVDIQLDERANKVDQPVITLRASEMELEQALQWISRLAEMEAQVDHENTRILIKKP